MIVPQNYTAFVVGQEFFLVAAIFSRVVVVSFIAGKGCYLAVSVGHP
jgi:hypothetical protein